VFLAAITFAMTMLVVLLVHIGLQLFSWVEWEVDSPEDLPELRERIVQAEELNPAEKEQLLTLVNETEELVNREDVRAQELIEQFNALKQKLKEYAFPKSATLYRHLWRKVPKVRIVNTYPLWAKGREQGAESDSHLELHFWLTPQFVVNPPSRKALESGIWPALVGTLWLMGLVAAIAFPLGVAAAIYLEEYAPDNRLTEVIQVNIANLAGVPSIVYGILGLTVFVRTFGAFGAEGKDIAFLGLRLHLPLGRSVLAGALTMSLLILPIIIIASREAIRAVPDSIRLASYALGATKWQTIWHQVLPAAFPGILTGTILALSRAIGETAPLIMIGALTYVRWPPRGLYDQFTVIPIQVFNWISLPQEQFRHLAAAGIVVLLAVLLSMNAVAVILRNRYRIRW